MIRKRKARTRILAPILPESYCKPIAGMMVASRHMEVLMTQMRSFSFPLATSYIQYPKSAVKRMLIKVRKMLIFMLHLFSMSSATKEELMQQSLGFLVLAQ